ncbi:class I SAM-dependent methyltransferase [Streptomyces sp. XM4011]|uniref:class I SAM-dependent methyltransferase n=1 Tax=Streptomyces sp. XM4011 TaxID=2929780 RepID=UPI001FF98314|nr:class I SAM-dependent methyltransferase [Streptomyces sp. XM4011]MCK1813740.1 class I SAM-dependent methyltransferase [Streptomyces sp. XM4011]
MKTDDRAIRVREVRRQLARNGPARTRDFDGDFEYITLPERDCDLLRDLLIAEQARTVVEVGLAYGSSALAVGEALVSQGHAEPRHILIDPFQKDMWANTGWDLLCSAGLDLISTLVPERSSDAFPQLIAEGLVADAAFVDGSHVFHEVFLDLYYLRKVVKPGGLVILDDDDKPSVRTAVHYFEVNLGWTALPDPFAAGTWRRLGDDAGGGSVPRCRALRLPEVVSEPRSGDFLPF